MILYFSGTGNSKYVAERIGKEVGDAVGSLFDRLHSHDFSEMYSEQPWIIVSPTYAWRIPRVLQEWLEKTKLSGSKEIYFVMTCGDSIGNAGKYLKKLCSLKGMEYKGCVSVMMPENYIALFPTPEKAQARETISHAENTIQEIIALIKNRLPFISGKITAKDRISSGLVNCLFYLCVVHAKKFYAKDTCVSCGLCASICPLGNIRFEKGKPVWGNHCTHCMACICRCPQEAIEYGRRSWGKARYYFPEEF